MATVSIPLHSRKYPGLFAIIDEEDYSLVAQYRWHICIKRTMLYAQTKINRKNHTMHRFLMDALPSEDVDHRDGDSLNNTRANLRRASRSQNLANQGPTKRNTSGFKGVFYENRRKKWYGRVYFQRKPYSSKCFSTPEEAAHAHDDLARLHHGEFAHLNFPDG